MSTSIPVVWFQVLSLSIGSSTVSTEMYNSCTLNREVLSFESSYFVVQDGSKF